MPDPIKSEGSSPEDGGKTPENPNLNPTDPNEGQPEEKGEVKPPESEGEDPNKDPNKPEDEGNEKDPKSKDGKEIEGGEKPEDKGNGEADPSKDERHAAKKIQELTEKNQQAEERIKKHEEAQERLVRNDANQLYEIAKDDPELADRLVKKVYGHDGVETLEELKIHVKSQKADEKDKPYWDRLLKQEKEIRSLKKDQEDRRAAEKELELKKFTSTHEDFKGAIKTKTLENSEKYQGMPLEEAYTLAKVQLAETDPDALKKAGADEAYLNIAKNKAGTRGGSETKVNSGGGKQLTPEQIKLAKRMKNDPRKSVLNNTNHDVNRSS